MFYHIKNLQSTKTIKINIKQYVSFITLRIYKVLKLLCSQSRERLRFITLRIYKVLKLDVTGVGDAKSFITLRIYKVLKPVTVLEEALPVLSH